MEHSHHRGMNALTTYGVQPYFTMDSPNLLTFNLLNWRSIKDNYESLDDDQQQFHHPAIRKKQKRNQNKQKKKL